MAFSYKATCTVTSNSALLPSTQTNYPLWVDITDNALKLVAGGGSVTDADGDDIVPYSDSGLSSILDFEMEHYDGTAGRWRAWVRIPSMALGTVFYIGIGNSAITTPQIDENGTWDADFQAVYHMADDVEGSRGHDSTVNGQHATATNTSDETGLLKSSLGFNGTTAHVTTPFTDLSYAAGTISCWAKPESAFNDGVQRVIWSMFNGGTSDGFGFQKFLDGNFYAGWERSGNDDRVVVASTGTTYPNGQWVYYEVTWANGGNTILRANGVQLGVQGSLNAISNVGATFFAGTDLWLGQLDEFRISDVVRSEDWGKADYNSQSDNATFLSKSVASVVTLSPVLIAPIQSNLRWR